MSGLSYSPSTSYSYSYDETDVRISEVMSCGSFASSTCDATADIPSIPQCTISEDERSEIVDVLKSPTPRTHFYVSGLDDSMIDPDTIIRRLRQVPKLETCVVIGHPNMLACLKKKLKAKTPRSVLFDLCVFSPSYPVLVLTFTNDKYKLEPAKCHSAQLSTKIEEVVKPYAKSDFSVVRGIIKEEDRTTDADFYKKVMMYDNDARLSSSLGSLALSMNQTKCVTIVSVFLDMLSSSDQSQGSDSRSRTEGRIPTDSDLSGADNLHEKSTPEVIAKLRKEKESLVKQVEDLTVDNLKMQSERNAAQREFSDGMKTEEELWLLLHNIGRNYPVHAWVNNLPVALQPGDEHSTHSRHDDSLDQVDSTSSHDDDLTDAGAIQAAHLVPMKSAMQTIDTLEGEYTYDKLKEENSNLRAENTGLKIDNAVLEKSIAGALKMLNDLKLDPISTKDGKSMDVYVDSQLQDEHETVIHSLSAKSTLLCKPHRFDKIRANTDVCHIDDNGLLVNSASRLSTSISRERSALKMYYGACSTCSIPLEQRPRAADQICSAEYWEIETEVHTGENISMRWRTVLEMGVLEQRYVDHHYWLYGRSRSWSMRVNYCNTHKTMCAQVWDEEHHISCQKESMSLDPNTTSTMKHGVVVDTYVGKVGFIDLDLKKVLHKIDVKFLERLCPLFRVSTIHTNNVVKMKLVSGRDIEMTDDKRELIHECLS